jgi:hypothetical protein
MDFTSALDSDIIYPLIWIIFSLFIGIALAIDLGVLNKIGQLGFPIYDLYKKIKTVNLAF